MEPPSRSSMWRFGYGTPKNYDDDGLYCGGIKTQWKQNGGKCGVCGDPWHISPPRPNEIGGKYGHGIIVRSYKTGQVIPVVVDITANHRGFFEFRVCPSKHEMNEVTQDCLDKHILKIRNKTSTRYYVEKHGKSRVILEVQLPRSLICKHCVFQWTYIAGNNWGKCKDGSHALGCGPQETFKACSDISIGEKSSALAQPVNTTLFQNTVKDKKKFPVFRPFVIRGTTFEEALDNIKKNPKLRWMLKPKKSNSQVLTSPS
ncbi:hypothetical protein X975_02112, partial [Stegodyphus mimosarum]